MSSIRASMEGELPELAEKLSRLSAIDKAGINNAIAEALRSGTIERFEGEKSPEGAAWNKSIRASEKGGLTLTMTGQLKGSINARATEEGAEVGTNLVYAATHQFGASGRRTSPILLLSTTDARSARNRLLSTYRHARSWVYRMKTGRRSRVL